MIAMFKMLTSAVFCVTFLITPLGLLAQDNAISSTEETRVYNAIFALMKFPKQDPSILISSVTLNLGCGEASGNPVRLNDCGIFALPITAESLETLLKQGLPAMDETTWRGFIHSNTHSTTLTDTFNTAWPHLVAQVNSASYAPWKSIDGAIFLSRVGFDTGKTQGLVYVLFFSYMAGVPTTGNYFLIQRDGEGTWQVKGRLTYMQTQ
jgi:hypothetical protein